MTPPRKPAGATKKAAGRQPAPRSRAAGAATKKAAARKSALPRASTASAAADSRALAPLADRRRKALAVLAALRAEYPESRCSLEHGDGWQLLVATILSAQCTDARVNQVTPGLFRQFPTPADFAAAPLAGIEEAIRSTGFFRNKAKSLQGAARALLENHGGRLPPTSTNWSRCPAAVARPPTSCWARCTGNRPAWSSTRTWDACRASWG